MLASYTVANTYLDGTKLSFASDSAAADYAAAADAVVKSYLNSVFPTEVGLWTDASSPTPPAYKTPALVEQAAGMFMASIYYRKKMSESQAMDVAYAMTLRDDAIALLCGLQDGSLSLPDIPSTVVSTIRFSREFFYPNDNTPFDDHTLETDRTKEDVAFKMGTEF